MELNVIELRRLLRQDRSTKVDGSRLVAATSKRTAKNVNRTEPPWPTPCPWARAMPLRSSGPAAVPPRRSPLPALAAPAALPTWTPPGTIRGSHDPSQQQQQQQQQQQHPRRRPRRQVPAPPARPLVRCACAPEPAWRRAKARPAPPPQLRGRRPAARAVRIVPAATAANAQPLPLQMAGAADHAAVSPPLPPPPPPPPPARRRCCHPRRPSPLSRAGRTVRAASLRGRARSEPGPPARRSSRP